MMDIPVFSVQNELWSNYYIYHFLPYILNTSVKTWIFSSYLFKAAMEIISDLFLFSSGFHFFTPNHPPCNNFNFFSLVVDPFFCVPISILSNAVKNILEFPSRSYMPVVNTLINESWICYLWIMKFLLILSSSGNALIVEIYALILSPFLLPLEFSFACYSYIWTVSKVSSINPWIYSSCWKIKHLGLSVAI